MHIEGNFLDCETSVLLENLQLTDSTGMLRQRFIDRIKHLLYQCFNKDAIIPYRYNSEAEYPFTNNGHIYLFCTNPIHEVNHIFIDNITSVLYIIQEHGYHMIYNVCKLEISPRMSLLLQYMLRRWNNQGPLFLGVDIWNINFNRAFDLYVRNNFSYFGINQNILLLQYIHNSANRSADEAIQYRRSILDIILEQQYRQRLFVLRWFGKKHSKNKFRKKSKVKSKK